MKGSAQGRRGAILGLSAYSAATGSLAGRILTASPTLAYLAHAPLVRNAKAQYPVIQTNARA